MNPEQEKEKAQWRVEKYNEILAELKADPTLQAILEETYPTRRASFMEDYAGAKVKWIENEQWHTDRLEEMDLQWTEAAYAALAQIQQKKLFDLQCLWRAEQMTIPGVVLTCDFGYWEKNIMACPFLDPVTSDEVDMYIRYLLTDNYEQELGWLEGWQDHEDICDAYRNDEEWRNVPAWYDFHNGLTGRSVYMTLPDIRGQKEEEYLDHWRKWRTGLLAAKGAAPTAADGPQQPLPPLPEHQDGWMKWFVATFEDEETRMTYARYQSYITPTDADQADRDEALEEDLYLMACAGRPVPIEAWYDWREAVHRAAARYRAQRIAEALPDAHAHYLMTVELGLVPETMDRKGIRTEYASWILKGRELCGEPRDFNF